MKFKDYLTSPQLFSHGKILISREDYAVYLMDE